MKIYDNNLNAFTPCTSFLNFLKNICQWYGQSVAFRTYTHQWTYQDLFDMVHDLVPYFSNSKVKYHYLYIDHPVYFCSAFFACIIAGKVVTLCPVPGENMQTFTEADVTELLVQAAQSCALYNCPFSDPKNVAIIAKSSGTTAFSKLVMLSQKNILSDTLGGLQLYDYPRGAVYYHLLPSSHLFGLVADILGPLYSGGTICFSNEKLNFFRDIQYFSPSHMNLPPAMVYMIEKMLKCNKNTAEITGGRLKKIMCAGAALQETTRIYLSTKGISVFPAYGLTECSPCISMNSERFFKVGSVGKVLPCCEVRIINHEITVRGDPVMLGYFNDLAATNRTIKNGWLYTGDLGYLDEDGFLFLTGRKSNIIVFEDGQKIIPDEIEQIISGFLGVKECLLSKKENITKNEVELTVVIEGSVDLSQLKAEIYSYFESIHLSERTENISFTSKELPKNELGKILRR